MRRSKIVICLLLCAVLCTNCLSDCVFGDPERRAIQKALRLIDQALEDLDRHSADWQNIVQQLADDLPEQLSQVIREDAQQLATRTIATGGVEFSCRFDFLADRAAANLRRLKAKLLGEDPPLLPPSFCQVSPASVKLEQSPDHWSEIGLYGYDIDYRDASGNRMKVLLRNAQGQTSYLASNRINFTTHYQVMLNLGGMGRSLHQSKIIQILVSWDGSTEGYPEIGVIPWVPDQKEELATVGRTTYMPPWESGDRDFSTDDDEHMEITAIGSLYSGGSQKIMSRVYFSAYEPRHDWTGAWGYDTPRTAYTAANKWRIISWRPRDTSRTDKNITSHGDHEYNQPAGEVVEKFVVWGDRDGDDAGVYTKVEVYWRQIRVTLEEIEPEWLR